MLLPIQKRCFFDPNAFGELGLRQAGARANGLDVRVRDLDLVNLGCGLAARVGNGLFEALFDAFEGVANFWLL